MAREARLDGVVVAEARSVLGHAPDVVEELAHGQRLTVTDSVHRVRVGTRSAIVKVVAAPTGPAESGSADPCDAWYRLREPALYEQGLPRPYRDAGIRAPEFLARFDRTDGAIAVWLEDLDGLPGSSWTSAQYETAARRLGRAQAPYLTGAAATDVVPWSRDFLADYLATWDDVGWDRIYDDDAWKTELIRANFPAPLREKLLHLCADRNRLIGWAALLPETICHHDVWANNLFEYEDHTTLIDWALAGHGHVGTDVGNLVSDSCGDLLQPTTLLPEFDAAATAGYREGLRDAGWTGDFRLVRFGVCLMAAKWSWLVPWMLMLAEKESHEVYGGEPVDAQHLFSERAAMLEYLTTWAAEARTLADELGLG